MYNSQGNQQMYNAQGTPVIYTPKGTEKPYTTPPLSTNMYGAQGLPLIIESFNGQPAFVSQDAKKNFWKERSARGFPVGASEWENKAPEKYGWVANDPSFVPVDVYPMPPRIVQDPTFVQQTTPTNFRGANEREVQAYEKPAYVPDRRQNNVANKGCFYTANGEISCPK